MKSFRQILGEVAQPKSAEERAFKDMHSYETMPHPVALDHQFTGAIGADDLPREKAKRLADQEGDANYDTSYDDAFEYEGPSFDESVELDEAEDLQELSVGTLAKYVQKKVGKNARDSEALKAFYAIVKTDGFKKLSKPLQRDGMKLVTDLEAKVKKAEKGINLAKLKATANADKLGIDIVFGKDGKSMAGSKIGLDEAPRRKGAPKMKGDYIAIQRAKDAEHNAAMGRTRTGRKKPVRTMTSTKKSLASMRRECAGEVELDEASASVYKDMPKAPGKIISNRVQVKAFKDVNAKGAFLSKQNDNSWQDTGVPGLKSGKYKIDMVKKGGKPSKNFIRVTEEVELDEGFNPKQIEQLKKAYASMPDRVPMDMAQKMGAMLKKRSKEELIAIARADIKWLSTTAATNLIMQGVKASEITGK